MTSNKDNSTNNDKKQEESKLPEPKRIELIRVREAKLEENKQSNDNKD